MVAGLCQVLYWLQTLNMSFLLTRAWNFFYCTRLVYKLFLQRTYSDMQDVCRFNVNSQSHWGPQLNYSYILINSISVYIFYRAPTQLVMLSTGVLWNYKSSELMFCLKLRCPYFRLLYITLPWLQMDKQVLCITWLLGMTHDENHHVRAAAVRGLGIYVLYPCLREVY